MSFIGSSDQTLAVGDFVLNHYTKNELLWKVVEIERRFLTIEDLRYSTYEHGVLGDEYDPLVLIESVVDLSIKADTKKKVRKQKKNLDAGYLTKVSPKMISNHLQRLSDVTSGLGL